MNLLKLAPYAAGSPPAVVLGFSLYNSVLSVAGPGFEWLAAIISVVGVIGMMTAEIYTYRQAARAIAVGEVQAFLLMLGGALVCSGLIVFAVYNGANSKSLISSVVVAVILYAAFAVDAFLKEREADRDRKLKYIKAQSSLERAKARQVEAVRPKTEQAEQKHERYERLNHERLTIVRNYMRSNKNATVRQVCEHCKISSTDTASRYMKAAR